MVHSYLELSLIRTFELPRPLTITTVAKTSKIISRDEAIDGISDHIDVDWFPVSKSVNEKASFWRKSDVIHLVVNQ